jgi:hypothetical protein
MAKDAKSTDHQEATGKFVVHDSHESTDVAVERELKRIRPQFNFTDADLRRLRQPRRRRAD